MKELLALARGAGLTVVLDGRIGREEYHSVTGSLAALQRFADAYANEPVLPGDIPERLRDRAEHQRDYADAFLMRAAARTIARLHYTNLSLEASAVPPADEPSSPSR